MGGFRWAAVCAAAVLAVASPAAALVLDNCTAGCMTNFGALFNVDYTVVADGQVHRWDLWSDLAHPDILITLDHPNETFDQETVSNGDGTFHTDAFLLGGASYDWNEILQPGHTTIFTRVWPTDFDHCSAGSPAGDICAAKFNVWGNGVGLTTTTTDPVTIFFSENGAPPAWLAVPEPATWAMMLVGFFGLGSVLRRRRALALGAA